MARELVKQFSIEYDESDLAKVAGIVEIRHGRKELENFLKKRLIKLEPDDNVRWICTLGWRAIFTTNYDESLLRAYDLTEKPKQTPVPFTLTADMRSIDNRFEVPIYYVHGTLFGATTPRIIITQDDFSSFREQRRMLFEKLKEESATSTMLYIGYSHRDPNWQLLINEIISEYYPSSLPLSYRISPNATKIDKELLKQKRIETIEADFGNFVESARVTLDKARIESDKLQSLRGKVPSDFIVAFDKNPASVTRLLSSWTYVNQVQLGDEFKLSSFLRGDKATWALLSAGKYFKRDLEDQLYEELLEYATTTRYSPGAILITGPAGYGMSTLLMVLALKVLTEKAGLAFMLRPSRSIIQGDIEYVISLFPDKKIFFFVDNAADNVEALNDSLQRLRDKKQSALFIICERLNEWRQSNTRIRVTEYALEPLSDPEIWRLLDFLKENCELNTLEPLDRDMQFNAVKKVYSKELLVVLRETTEGRTFDAILEDEYSGIKDDISKKLYLVVCCFYQNNAYIRDSLLAQILSKPIEEFYRLTKDTTEGVVLYDCIDEANGIYAARARHRIIAEVVWQRCGNIDEKSAIIQDAIAALNIAYKTDRDAFEYLVRSDRIIDSMRSLEGKMKFFETACKKDPSNPYVRQHYSRMLSREKHGEVALGQIDEAIRMNSRIRVFYHTKGIVLYKLALSEKGRDMAMRRMVQSEESFRTCIRMYSKDVYGYQGLAQLYREWAQQLESEQEAADYIGKAEEVINEGLKKANIKYPLWLESAKLQ